jgi:putative membrane protein
VTAIWSDLVAAWTELSLVAQISMAAWALAIITLPIVRWTWSERALPWSVTAGVLLQLTTVLAVLGPAWGWRKTTVVALAIPAMGWAVEVLGSTTGFPFGRYRYTGRLQPQVRHVPVLVPLAWLMMLPPSWAVAGSIAGDGGLTFVLTSALAFTAWDLFLDPQMVSWGLWEWDRPGGYFGIPWSNYIGWALAAAVMTAVLRPGPLPKAPLQLIYALTWLLEAGGLAILWRQPGPAMFGFFGMGGMLRWAWLSNRPF